MTSKSRKPFVYKPRQPAIVVLTGDRTFVFGGLEPQRTEVSVDGTTFRGTRHHVAVQLFQLYAREGRDMRKLRKARRAYNSQPPAVLMLDAAKIEANVRALPGVWG